MRALPGSLALGALVWSCSKPQPPIAKEDAAPGRAQPAGGDYQVLWCRGGGKSSADTDLEVLSVSNRGTRGTVIAVTFEFARSDVPAGVDGSALAPGTCAYVDRAYDKSPIKLTFNDGDRADVRWRTTADGTSAPTVTSAADGIRSDKWFMKAQITKAAYIGSYESFTR